MSAVNKIILRTSKMLPIVRDIVYGKEIYGRLRSSEPYKDYYLKNRKNIRVVPVGHSKIKQIVRLIDLLSISPVENSLFFYSIDVNKMAASSRGTSIFDNFTPDYRAAIFGFTNSKSELIKALMNYVQKCKKTKYGKQYECALNAIESIFHRPAETLFEGLQRILFINQFIWQTGHTLIGLGHLDWNLENLYNKDINSGNLTYNDEKEIVKEFLKVLHHYYEYKSNSLLGDTGQVIIIGGKTKSGYKCNDLSKVFLESLKELHLPDPKIVLRYSNDIPDELLEISLKSISTGIGSPIISNDDIIIKTMITFGYKEADAYNYGVSACWEPLVIGKSFDNNNCNTINFASPFLEMLNERNLDGCGSLDDIVKLYDGFLRKYIKSIVDKAYKRVYEKDPLLSLLCLGTEKKDFCRGDATYNNTGFTSVGLSSVVNSLLNLEQLVISKNKYTFSQVKEFRLNNFKNPSILIELKESKLKFGCDDKKVIDLTNQLMEIASDELSLYNTKYGGKYKIGFSSPNYINCGTSTKATLDGRKNGEAFSTHISTSDSIPYTEILNFASQLKYDKNRFNGNVVDLFIPPNLLNNNKDKFKRLLKVAFLSGVFQLQMNVVDSKTLLHAKEHPEKYPDLIVRVWGFSAYFNDLPLEYKDLLIERAKKAEGSSG